jgi:hypothetical protein
VWDSQDRPKVFDEQESPGGLAGPGCRFESAGLGHNLGKNPTHSGVRFVDKQGRVTEADTEDVGKILPCAFSLAEYRSHGDLPAATMGPSCRRALRKGGYQGSQKRVVETRSFGPASLSKTVQSSIRQGPREELRFAASGSIVVHSVRIPQPEVLVNGVRQRPCMVRAIWSWTERAPSVRHASMQAVVFTCRRQVQVLMEYLREQCLDGIRVGHDMTVWQDDELCIVCRVVEDNPAQREVRPGRKGLVDFLPDDGPERLLCVAADG